MTTNAAFVAAMQDLSVDGVERHYNEPPQSLNTADLPAAFPMMPSGEKAEPFSTCVEDSKARSMEYVIALEAIGQGTNAQNYGKLAALMDALETALDALTVGVFRTYSITTNTTRQVAGVDYWAIVANVEVRNG